MAGGLAKERFQVKEISPVLAAVKEKTSLLAPPSLLAQEAGRERTFIMIKPDGVQRGLVGDIIKRFEQKGFKLVAIRMMRPGRGHLEEHYADLSKRPFFPGLVQYMDSGPVVAMCWEGEGVVKTGRVMLGETNPRDSKPGTIRGDYCIQVSLSLLFRSLVPLQCLLLGWPQRDPRLRLRGVRQPRDRALVHRSRPVRLDAGRRRLDQ